MRDVSEGGALLQVAHPEWLPPRFRLIIEANGFVLSRHHRRHVRYVTIACHSHGDDVKPKTLASIIRQSGLPKKIFR